MNAYNAYNAYKGKVAVITGAGRGLGRGIALHCAQNGMKVVLAGIRPESLIKTEADLRALGAETLIVQTDVAQLEQVEYLAEQSYNTFGSVDLLVNNAGVSVRNSVLASSWTDWQWVMEVNFYGVLYAVKTFLPKMMAQPTPSRVVNVASACGVIGGKICSKPYGVSKTAVVTLTEALYQELAEEAPHVRISTFCPAEIATEFYRIDDSRPERYQQQASRLNAAEREQQRIRFSGGFPVEKAVEILFEGIEKDQLYIGMRAYLEMYPDFGKLLHNRVDEIMNEPGLATD